MARACAAGDAGADAMAHARVQTPSGNWLIVRGAMLDDGSGQRAAVILEPAQSTEIAPLIAGAHGLTEREQRITQLVAHGRSTREISSELHLSESTVQDHLKAVSSPRRIRRSPMSEPPRLATPTFSGAMTDRKPPWWRTRGLRDRPPDRLLLGRVLDARARRPWKSAMPLSLRAAKRALLTRRRRHASRGRGDAPTQVQRRDPNRSHAA